jgi:hypothetical protein
VFRQLLTHYARLVKTRAPLALTPAPYAG